MTDELVREAERALREHGAFEAADGAFRVTTSPFETSVRITASGPTVRYAVTVWVPSIDAVVRGETVAPVVQDGWFETFERRMEDVGGVTRVEPEPPTVDRAEEIDEVVVETSFETGIASRGADDAKAVVDYVEGTYMEGIIPGYEYREPVRGMLDRARQEAGGTGEPPL